MTVLQKAPLKAGHSVDQMAQWKVLRMADQMVPHSALLWE
jgi:hypothetical protein